MIELNSHIIKPDLEENISSLYFTGLQLCSTVYNVPKSILDLISAERQQNVSILHYYTTECWPLDVHKYRAGQEAAEREGGGFPRAERPPILACPVHEGRQRRRLLAQVGGGLFWGGGGGYREEMLQDWFMHGSGYSGGIKKEVRVYWVEGAALNIIMIISACFRGSQGHFSDSGHYLT